MEIRFYCPLRLARCGVFPVYGSLSWVTSIFFASYVWNLRWKLFVCETKKTGNKEVKIFADILFLWTVNGVCLVSCFLNPKS
jgi:hypothetical protein